MPAPYDPVPVLNVSGEDIPSHAVVETLDAFTDGAVHVTKPTRTGYRGVLVNGPGVIPTGQAGEAYAHPRVVAKAAAEPDAVGDEWGAVAGAWHLDDVGGGGFLFIGGYADGRANWVRYGVRDVNPSGSGSGTDTDGDGTADRRLVGYNYDVACVGGVLQKSRQPIYQFLGSGLSSYGSWEAAGTVGCCECDSDPSDGGPTGGGASDGSPFGICEDIPTTLRIDVTSSDSCFDGLTTTATWNGVSWPISFSSNVCGCDNEGGFGCGAGGLVPDDMGITYNSNLLVLVSYTASPFSATFQVVTELDACSSPPTDNAYMPAGTLFTVTVA